jgi:hypothetical protein
VKSGLRCFPKKYVYIHHTQYDKVLRLFFTEYNCRVSMSLTLVCCIYHLHLAQDGETALFQHALSSWVLARVVVILLWTAWPRRILNLIVWPRLAPQCEELRSGFASFYACVGIGMESLEQAETIYCWTRIARGLPTCLRM